MNWEADVYVAVRLSAGTDLEARKALQTALSAAEESCAKLNVEFEWQLEGLVSDGGDE